MIKALAFLICLLTICVHAQIPADRLPLSGLWGDCGIPGGIPTNRTTIFTNFSGGATAAQVQNGVNLCPSNQVVHLAAGRYAFSATVCLSSNFVVVRGDGMGQTIVSNTAGVPNFQFIQLNGEPEESGSFPPAMLLATNLFPGVTNLALQTTNNLYPGMMLWLVESNDGIAVLGYGDGGSFNPSPPDVGDNNNTLNWRVMVQSVSGSNVTFLPPLMFGFATNLSARAYAVKGVYGPGACSMMSGLENMTLQGSSSGAGIFLQYAYESWVKNVEISGYNTWGVWPLGCLNCEFRQLYIHHPSVYDNSHGYAMLPNCINDCLVVDSIFFHDETGFVLENAPGNAFVYNLAYDITNGYAIVEGNIGEGQRNLYGSHYAGSYWNLWEGNYASGFQSDFYGGSSGHSILFRNFLTGTDPSTTQLRALVMIDSHSWSNTVAGNVLGGSFSNGTPSVVSVLTGTTIPWQATNTPPSIYGFYNTNNVWTHSFSGTGYSGGDTTLVYRIGYARSGDTGSIGIRSDGGTNCLECIDLLTKTNTLLLNNWDIVSNSIVNATNNLPTSLIYSSKPAWFGNRPWPAFDATMTLGSLSMTNIPAGFRFVFGTDPTNSTATAAITVNASLIIGQIFSH